MNVNFAKNVKSLVKDLLIIGTIWVTFTTFAFAAYHIPSESMQPTLEVGDRIFVNKFVYGYSHHSLPFSPDVFDGRIPEGAPDRGEVVVFEDPQQDNTTFIKRVIGMPGDRVQMRDGRLWINDQPVERRLVRVLTYEEFRGGMVRVSEYEEILPGGNRHLIYERSDNDRFDETRQFIVPEGHVFAMGDNRDNSKDSRASDGFGMVAIEQIVGRAEIISFSLADCQEVKGSKCFLGLPFNRYFNGID